MVKSSDDNMMITIVENILLKRLGDRMRRSPRVRHEIAAEIIAALKLK